MSELISVVVATYNQAQHLPICLDSIWFQNYPEIEIIVVNDGSTDNTVEVLNAYQKALETEQASYASRYNEQTQVVERAWHRRYPREGREIVIVNSETNNGLSAALNTGFKAAQGELCTFISSDDELLPSMCSTLCRTLQEREADFFAYADMHAIDDAGRILRGFALPDYTFEASFCDWYLCVESANCTGVSCTKNTATTAWIMFHKITKCICDSPWEGQNSRMYQRCWPRSASMTRTELWKATHERRNRDKCRTVSTWC